MLLARKQALHLQKEVSGWEIKQSSMFTKHCVNMAVGQFGFFVSIWNENDKKENCARVSEQHGVCGACLFV